MSAQRQPIAIKKTINKNPNKKQTLGKKGTESDSQSYHIIRFKCPIFNNNNKKSQVIQRNRNIWPIQSKERNHQKLSQKKKGIYQRLFKNCFKVAQKTKRRYGEGQEYNM